MTEAVAYDKMTERDILDHVRPFIEKTVAHGRAGIECNIGIQAAVVTCEKELLNSNTSARAALHAINGRLAAIQAAKQLTELESPAGTVGNPAPGRVLSVLFLAGVASLAVAAGYPLTEGRPMTSIHPAASTEILAGKADKLRGDYRNAIEHFQAAGAAGAVPECYLPDVIECYLSTQQYGLALSTTADLSGQNPRNQSLVPYYRGCALYQLGRRGEARSELAEAKKLGHPMADVVLRGMGGL